ncbi:MAG: bacteriohemerythrin [Halopseudomonas sp.]
MYDSTLLNWSEDYRLGHARIDAQHQQLFKLLREMEQSIEQCRGNETARKGLLALVDYSRYHFDAEEGHMRRLGYPGLAAHQQEHKGIINEIEHLLDEGKPVLTVELVYFVRRWLADHIINSDMKIRDYQKTLANDDN